MRRVIPYVMRVEWGVDLGSRCTDSSPKARASCNHSLTGRPRSLSFVDGGAVGEWERAAGSALLLRGHK